MGESGVDKASLIQSKIAGRRQFLMQAAAAVGTILGLETKPADALGLFPTPKKPFEERPIAPNPETPKNLAPEIPKSFKEPIEKAAELASNFLNEREEINLKFMPGEATAIIVKYHELVDENTVTNPSLVLRFSTKDRQPWKYTNLQVGEKLAEIINKNRGNFITEKFAAAFLQYGKVDLKALSQEKAPADEIARLAQLKNFFDFANYTDGINRDVIAEKKGNIAQELYGKVFSLWLFEPGKLADKIEQAPVRIRVNIANIFLSGLIRTLDCVGVNAKFDTLGFDRKSIDRVLKVSGNEVYTNYIKEKSEFMGVDISRTPKNIDEYLIAFHQR